MNNEQNPLVENATNDQAEFDKNKDNATKTGVGEKRKGGNKKAGVAVML